VIPDVDIGAAVNLMLRRCGDSARRKALRAPKSSRPAITAAQRGANHRCRRAAREHHTARPVH
jgi:hypothetical protein